jgi:hypothetical protein
MCELQWWKEIRLTSTVWGLEFRSRLSLKPFDWSEDLQHCGRSTSGKPMEAAGCAWVPDTCQVHAAKGYAFMILEKSVNWVRQSELVWMFDINQSASITGTKD